MSSAMLTTPQSLNLGLPHQPEVRNTFGCNVKRLQEFTIFLYPGLPTPTSFFTMCFCLVNCQS